MSDNVNPPLVVLAQSYPDRKNPKKAIVKAAHNILFPQIVLYGAEYYGNCFLGTTPQEACGI